MKNEIGFSGLIDKSKLQTDNYFSSLVKQAYDCGLIFDSDIERIRTELFLLLGDICKTIAEKGSSSIRVDTAEEISESIMYSISVRLKKCPSPESSVNLLQSEKIKVLFEEGQKELSDMLIKMKIKWTILKGKLFETKSFCFNEIPKETMKRFFAGYDYKLSAQKDVVLFGYPVYNESEKLSGAELISQKLESFILENEFLNNFNPQSVHSLLCLIDRIYGENEKGEGSFYLETPINIYIYVLACALGLVMCKKEPHELKLEKEDYDFIESRLVQKNYKSVLVILRDALDKLIAQLMVGEKTAAYLELSIRQLADEIALSYGMNLKSIFLCSNNKAENEGFIIEGEPKLSDSKFRFVLEQIRSLGSIEKIAQVIGENVKNEEDFEELVISACLNKNEIALCLRKLQNPAFIRLFIKYFRGKKDEINKDVYAGINECFRSFSKREKNVIEKILRTLGEYK